VNNGEINKKRLKKILEGYGEFPAKYRFVVVRVSGWLARLIG